MHASSVLFVLRRAALRDCGFIRLPHLLHTLVRDKSCIKNELLNSVFAFPWYVRLGVTVFVESELIWGSFRIMVHKQGPTRALIYPHWQCSATRARLSKPDKRHMRHLLQCHIFPPHPEVNITRWMRCWMCVYSLHHQDKVVEVTGRERNHYFE